MCKVYDLFPYKTPHYTPPNYATLRKGGASAGEASPMLLSLTVVLDYFVPTDAKRRLPNAGRRLPENVWGSVLLHNHFGGLVALTANIDTGGEVVGFDSYALEVEVLLSLIHI